MSDIEVVMEAAEIASLYHAGQTYGDKPYIHHPLSVAQQVAARGGSTAQVVAALLHDAVEDTDLTTKQVRMMFGYPVAEIVEAVTKRPGETAGDYLDRIQGDAVLVKLCDSICNLAGLPDAEMPEQRKRKLTARYQRNIAVLSDRLRGLS